LWVLAVSLVSAQVPGADRSVVVAPALSGVADSTGETSPSVASGRRWLFVVAVDKYQHPEFLTPLQNCVNDAVALRDTLRSKYGFTNVVELFNDSATESEIKARLDDLAGRAGPEDDVIVFFSGHGNLNDRTQIGYWYPVDARRATDGLSNSVVKDYCAALRARHVLVVADCCFAGSLLVRSAPSPEDVGRRSREVIVSGNLTPVADSGPTPDARGNSVFTHYLLKTLEEKARAGAEFNSNDLYVRLFDPVKANSRQEPQKGVLQVAGHEGGSFRFFPGGFWPASAPSQLEQLAEESRAAARRLAGAKMAFARAQEIDSNEALSAAEKLKAWELAMSACSPARHRVGEIQSRMDRWKKASSRGDYTEGAGVGLGLAMVWVKPGSFRMGSPDSEAGRFDNEGPVHDVELDGFWLGKTEVTVGQFRKFVNATGWKTDAEKSGKSYGLNSAGTSWEEQSGLSWRNAGFAQGDDHPVVHVSWNDGKGFCDWLSGSAGKSYRLPSEAQWEFACRGGSTGAYAWGSDADSGKGWLNGADANLKRKYPNWPFGEFGFDDGYVYTSPVGSFRVNGFGLHDMHGNVWEWCSDWYGSYSSGSVRNPTGPSEGSDRVSRGGGWYFNPRLCRSANRDWSTPGDSNDFLGFRVLAVPAASR
jgi:formylglycine-generating enzyme required for sulfatase activity